jgi:hypothetical protein
MDPAPPFFGLLFFIPFFLFEFDSLRAEGDGVIPDSPLIGARVVIDAGCMGCRVKPYPHRVPPFQLSSLRSSPTQEMMEEPDHGAISTSIY